MVYFPVAPHVRVRGYFGHFEEMQRYGTLPR